MLGIWPSSRVDLGYTEILRVPALISVPSRLVTVFLGTLCSSINQIKAPYVFDWEQGISLQVMQNIWPQLSARGKSHDFSRVAAGTWGIFSSYGGDNPSKLVFVQQRQDSCLVTRDTSGISICLGRAIWTLLELRRETKFPFLVATVIF